MPADAPIVDSHHHFWDLQAFQYPWMTPDLSVLLRNYLPSDLAPLIGRAGVSHTVFIQAQHNLAENDWALDLAEKFPWIAGIVGWVDLTSPSVAEQLARYRDQPKFVGVRHIVQDEPDPRWLLRPDVLAGLGALAGAGKTYDLLVRPEHLRFIPEVADRVPELRLVVDHLGKPDYRASSMTQWRDDLQQVARIPGVCCKISGMISEGDRERWRADDFARFVDVVLELFGPERAMFGTDWPVCLLGGSYSEAFAVASYALRGLTAAERASVFGGAAVRFYRLPIQDPDGRNG